MTTRHSLSALLTILTVASCSRPTPEQQFLNDVTTALGGHDDHLC